MSCPQVIDKSIDFNKAKEYNVTMTKKNIKVDGSVSVSEKITVRRVPRSPNGTRATNISFSLPESLHQTINGIVVETKRSRSSILNEIIADGVKKFKEGK